MEFDTWKRVLSIQLQRLSIPYVELEEFARYKVDPPKALECVPPTPSPTPLNPTHLPPTPPPSFPVTPPAHQKKHRPPWIPASRDPWILDPWIHRFRQNFRSPGNGQRKVKMVTLWRTSLKNTVGLTLTQACPSSTLSVKAVPFRPDTLWLLYPCSPQDYTIWKLS